MPKKEYKGDGKIFYDLVQSRRLSINDAQALLEISRGTLYNYYESEALDASVKDKIAKAFELSVEQIFGVNSNSEGDRIRQKKAFGEKEKVGIIYVPIPAQAGYSKNYLDPVYLSDLGRWRIQDLPYEGERYRVFQVKGDSMEYIDKVTGKPAGFFEGMDVVAEIVDPEDWKTGQIPPFHVYIIVMEDEILIKRILIKDDGSYVMHSDNPATIPKQRLLDKKEIKELWYVKRKLDWGMAPPEKIEIEI